jgi:hypothetical protein
MESWKMQANVDIHYADPETRGEWALSIASLPGATADEIVRDAPFVKQSVYRIGNAADLIDAGFRLVEDDPPHALILLDGRPDEETFERLRALFPKQVENPYSKERKHGSQ